jgi:succinate-acetate transporter protein
VTRPDAPAARIYLRPVATPLPIGMIALAVGSFVLAGKQLQWISSSQSHMVGWCLLGFVVPLQLIGFVFALLSRDEGVASAMATLAGTWLATALVTLNGVPGTRNAALGLLLIAAAGALLVPAAVGAPTKPLIAVVVAVTATRFAITGIYQLGAGSAWKTAAGIVGLVITALAWYAAAAFALEAGQRRQVLPTLRRHGHAGPSPEESDDPIGPVTHDAGVRSQL